MRAHDPFRAMEKTLGVFDAHGVRAPFVCGCVCDVAGCSSTCCGRSGARVCLLGSVCDEFWLVRDGAATRFDGDLQDYAQSLSRDARSGQSTTIRRSEDGIDRREQRRRDAAARQQLTALRTEFKNIEKELERLTMQRRELEQQMLDSASSGASDSTVRAAPQRLGAVIQQIEALEERWLEIGGQLESAGSQN